MDPQLNFTSTVGPVKPKWRPSAVQKKIAFVGGIVILFFLAGYGYASYLARNSYNEVARQAKLAQDAMLVLEQQRAQNPTSGWQTYTNTEYGFEVKYPEYLEPQVLRDNFVFIATKNADSFMIELSGLEYTNAPGGIRCDYDIITKTWNDDTSPVKSGCPQEYDGRSDFLAYKGGIGDMSQVFQIGMVLIPERSKFVRLYVGQNYFDSCVELNQCPDIGPVTDKNTVDQILSTFRFTN